MTSIELATENSFQLKADFFPVTVMKVMEPVLDNLEKQLDNTIAQAPKYLTHAPLIIDLTAVSTEIEHIDIPAFCALLRRKQIIPIGLRGLPSDQRDLAESNGLAFIKPRHSSDSLLSLASGNAVKSPPNKPQKPEEAAFRKTMTITKAVRAGTQLYAKNADLLILAPVNAGAECIADGNIHIYGPLRGRALAGARGDKNARIFCESLEGELVSIAGHYLVSEQLKTPITKKPMIQLFLKDDKVIIEGI